MDLPPPPPSPHYAQQIVDAEHLRLLSILNYVMSGLCCFFGLIPLIHVGIGIVMLSSHVAADISSHGQMNPGWFFISMGLFVIAVAQTIGVLTFCSARCIAARKRPLFCRVVAGIQCVQIPFGTALGVFTFVVLERPSVKALFR